MACAKRASPRSWVVEVHAMACPRAHARLNPTRAKATTTATAMPTNAVRRYVAAYRDLAMVEYERSIGFSHSCKPGRALAVCLFLSWTLRVPLFVRFLLGA